MSVIGRLKIQLGADARPLAKDLDASVKQFDKLEQAAGRTGGTIGGIRGPQAGAAASAAGTGSDAAGLEKIRATLAGGGMGGGIAVNLGKEFDRIGGTIVTMFRRIDTEMKFPRTEAAFKKVESAVWKVGTTWTGMDLFGKIKKSVGDGATYAIGQTEKAYNPVAAIGEAWNAVTGRITAARAEVIRLAAAEAQAAALAAHAPGPMGRGRAHGTTGTQVAGVGRQIPLAGSTAPKASDFAPFELAAAKAMNAVSGIATTAATKAKPAIAALATSGIIGLKSLASVTEAISLAFMAPIRLAAIAGTGMVKLYHGVWNLQGVFESWGDVAGKTYSKLFSENGILRGAIVATGSAAGRLGKAIFNIGTLGAFKNHAASANGMKKSIISVGDSADALIGKMKSLAGEVAMAIGAYALTSKAVNWIKDGVKAASDLNETVSRSKVVFGDSFGSVEDQAKGLQSAYGVSRKAQIDMASGYGAMAEGAGYSAGESAKLSNQLVKMAADLSSSVNIPFEEAAEKIRSGLAGESEPLRQFGVSIDEDTVKAYAMQQGFAAAGSEISAHAKIAARAELITRGLSYTQDDLARTSDGAANQFRKAGGGIADFGERIGELLLPAVTVAITAFNDLMTATRGAFEEGIVIFEGWASNVKSGVEAVAVVTRNLGDYWEMTTIKAREMSLNVLAVFATLPENIGKIATWIGKNWYQLITDALNATIAAFKNFGTNITNLGSAIGEWLANPTAGFQFNWTPLLDGFKATADAFPELARPAWTSLQADIDKVGQRIADKEAARAAALKKDLPPAGKIPGALDLPGKDKKDKPKDLAKALEYGSKEAYTAIVKSDHGGKDKTSKNIEKNTADHVVLSKQILAAIKENKGTGIEVYSMA